MGHTYAGAAAAGWVIVLCVIAARVEYEDEGFGGADTPSITRFDEDGDGLFKYLPGSVLNFSPQEVQQK
jgi:hypothetical protein